MLPHISEWEGGLSADPRDTCADDPSPILATTGKFKGKPLHTNRGVCWMTWKSVAPKLGFPATAQAWVNMTQEQWQKVIKVTFWDAMQLDSLNSQSIAELLMDATWGSGKGGARTVVRELQRIVGLTGKDVDGYVGRKTVEATNAYLKKNSEKALYEKLWAVRLKQLQELGKQPQYAWALGGWINRMNSLLDRSKKFVAENPKTISVFGILLLGGMGYAIYKYLDKVVS